MRRILPYDLSWYILLIASIFVVVSPLALRNVGCNTRRFNREFLLWMCAKESPPNNTESVLRPESTWAQSCPAPCVTIALRRSMCYDWSKAFDVWSLWIGWHPSLVVAFYFCVLPLLSALCEVIWYGTPQGNGHSRFEILLVIVLLGSLHLFFKGSGTTPSVSPSY